MDQLRSIQSSWDENGDGKVSVEELRKGYDTNGDGKIDESELSTLADQLSNQLSVQTSYTNRLLSQLQQLEEQSLKHQQEAQARESTLRRTMEAMDQARADSNMLRSRLQNANDVIDQNRREEQDQMAGAHEKDRQVAALQKIVDQQAHDLDRANSEVMDTRSSLDRIRRSNAESQNELEEQKRRFAEEQVKKSNCAVLFDFCHFLFVYLSLFHAINVYHTVLIYFWNVILLLLFSLSLSLSLSLSFVL